MCFDAFGQDDHELLATHTSDEVAVAHHRPQRRGEHAQRAVADVVAVRVVELLEPVEVADRHRERHRLAEQTAHHVVEAAPVETGP